MQQILSIDISKEQAHAVVLKIEDGNVSVEEHHSTELPRKNFSKNVLEALQILSKDEPPQDDEASKHTNLLTELKTEFSNCLTSLLSKIKLHYEESILLIPALDNLSMQINLPFADPKNIKQIIDMEVQDTLPFNVNDFIVPYKEVRKNDNNENEFFVSLAPKSLVAFFIDSCKASDLEPHVVSTRAGILNAIYNLEDMPLANHAVCLHISDASFHINMLVDKQTVFCRTLELDDYSSENKDELLLSQIKLTLNAQEKKFGVTFESIYLLASTISKEQVQQSLGRSVETFGLQTFIHSENGALQNDGGQLATLAGLSLQENGNTSVLTNFRVREFSYHPQITQLVEGAKRIMPYAGLVAMLFFFYVVSIFLSREYRIIRLQKAVTQSASSLGAEQTFSRGSEISELQTLNRSLETQLESLGTRSQLSALDILFDITEDIEEAKKRSPDLQIREIGITASGVIVAGNARAYSEVERFEKVLKRRRELYCKVRRDTSNSNARSRGFKFILTLCDA